jgi:hypothetical protein
VVRRPTHQLLHHGVDPTDHAEVADSINKHFCSIAKNMPVLNSSSLPSYLPAPDLCPTIYEWEVYDKLKKLNRRKAGGPDGIPAAIIREFAYELSKPLTNLLNSSYQQGVVPSQWKKAVVIPLPKSSPPSWDQLRPVSLTDHFAKLAETFVTEWILTDIEDKLDHNQFGNRKGVSTCHYLVKLINNLCSHADTPKSQSSIVITDFSKAFDLINHNIVIRDLLDLGARPSVIPWVCSFLEKRSQCVRYKNQLSENIILKGGLPQGTKFGPLGFLAKFNSAVRTSDTEGQVLSLKYVDDMTIIENLNSKTSSNKVMQTTLDDFSQWANNNDMKLNPDKCVNMNVSFLRNPLQVPPLQICSKI